VLPWWREIRETLLLAFPLIVGNLVQMLIGITDTIMIGKLGVIPLATATLANSISMIFFVCAIGFLTAVSVRISQLRGARTMSLIPQSLWHGLVLSAILGVGTLLATWLLLPYLGKMGQPEEVIEQIPGYLMLINASLIPGLLTMALKNFMEAFERPWTPLLIVMVGVVVNIGLNFLLIYGMWGFPRLELLGAGLATLLARIFTLVLFMFYLYGSRFYREYMPRWGALRIYWEECWIYIRLGVPAAMHLLAEVSTFAGFAFMMGWFGAVAMAAHQVAITVISVVFMIPLGMGVASTIRIGKAYGANHYRSVMPLGLASMIPGVLFMACSASFLWWKGAWVASWFIQDTEVIQLVVVLFGIAVLFQLADGLLVIASCCLRGLSDVRIPMWISMIGYWGLAWPFAWWFAFHLDWGPRGIWSGLAVAVVVNATAMATRFFLRCNSLQKSSYEAGLG
jgi:MATE family multidrug resistance protein